MLCRSPYRLFSVALVAWPAYCAEAQNPGPVDDILVVNMVPRSVGFEEWQDSEPYLAVNPVDPDLIVGSAMTRNPTLGADRAPLFFSTDGGETWHMNNVIRIPGYTEEQTTEGSPIIDPTVQITRSGDSVYVGALLRPFPHGFLFRTEDIAATSPLTFLTDPIPCWDQPHVHAFTNAANEDELYLGINFTGPYQTDKCQSNVGNTASFGYAGDVRNVLVQQQVAVSSLGNRTVTLGDRDLAPVRITTHEDGVAFAIYYRALSSGATGWVADLVLAKNDPASVGSAPDFDQLTGANSLRGITLVGGIVVPTEKLGSVQLSLSSVALAVNPDDEDEIWFAWGDNVSTTADLTQTLHVRRWTLGSALPTTDERMIVGAMNPGLAINSDGEVGFLYQQLVQINNDWEWETRLDRKPVSGSWTSVLLAQTPDTVAVPKLRIGDYLGLTSVERTFYGVFSASNVPDPGNFPHDVVYLREADFSAKELHFTDGSTVKPVKVSVDPFFFKVKRLE